MKTIFVQIAAYRDPDLPATLHNLIRKAIHPQRLRFGLCLQLDPSDPIGWRKESFPAHPYLRVLDVPASLSGGACWARHKAQHYYQGEDLWLQIDSHMRTVTGWDEILLQTLDECNDPMAVLSGYPNAFTKNEAGSTDFLHMDTLPLMAAKEFDNHGILKFQGIARAEWPAHPVPGAFMSGGFAFGPGRIVEQVPYDPHLYFDGEEIAMSARLWTHGYNFYNPNRFTLFHLYKDIDPKKRPPNHWGDHEKWFKRNRRALVRVHALLNSLEHRPPSLELKAGDLDDFEQYCLGTARRLTQYEEWIGVSFKRRTIAKQAIQGVFPVESFS